MMFANTTDIVDQCVMLWKCMHLPVRAEEWLYNPGEQNPSAVSLTVYSDLNGFFLIACYNKTGGDLIMCVCAYIYN